LISPRDGDQFLLGLEVGGGKASSELPWGGRSPRGLTKARERFIFKARAEKSVSDFVRDEGQYDLWLPMTKVPWKYQGAPSLLPLPRKGVYDG